MIEIFTTRFKKEILTEFVAPTRKTKHQKVIILASGMPGYPGKKAVMEFLSKKGYWVFNPRYRGTWESYGEFLKHSPEKDINDVIECLSKPFTEIWSKKSYHLKPHSIFLIGASFGGAAAILCSKNPKVTKAIAIAPVVDWKIDSKIEPMPLLEKLTKEAFGPAYKFKHNNWQALAKGKFYNPIDHIEKLSPAKLFIIHALDDDMVPIKPTQTLVKTIKCKYREYKKGGHLGTSLILKPAVYKLIKHFLAK